VPGDAEHRLLQHHYAFAFFADTKMQSFYKRFVRDYMRYKDEIQCAGNDDARTHSLTHSLTHLLAHLTVYRP
jgi:hypothetical protein